MYPYTSKLLRVDLSGEGSCVVEEIDEGTERMFLGGPGLAARILLDRMDWKGDPLGAENKLVFAIGPLTGTNAPAGCRYVVCGKSPLGIWGEAHAGGFWGPELKFCGFDAILIQGKASNPVYIWIHDGGAEIRDAAHLWNKDTYETEEIIREDLGDSKIRVVAIGIGGENLSTMACIVNDGGRVAGRTGLGAVMGSKHLKAIAIRGRKGVNVADKERFSQLVRQYNKNISQHPAVPLMRKFGTHAATGLIARMGDVPIKNWRLGDWEGLSKLDGPGFESTIRVRNYHCWGCLMGCGQVAEVKEGPYRVERGHAPEYEAVASFGAMCLNDSMESIAKANDLCTRYGLDVISTGATVAFAMECYDKGLIGDKDTNGLELRWGNHDAIIKLIERIANRRGLGELLADGTREAAQRIGKGSEEFAIHTKGLELPMHNPKAFSSWALAYATSNRGACHLQATTYVVERGLTFPSIGMTELLDRFSSERKAELTKTLQDFYTIIECLGMCKFLIYVGFQPEDFAALFSAASGQDMPLNEILKIGERTYNLIRCLNVIMGVSRKDDTLPKRLLSEPYAEGGAKGFVPVLDPMLDEYYALRGWDANGIPTKEKLRELSLESLCDRLP